MKVIKVGNEEADFLTEDEVNKIAILKLVELGTFIEGVGIRDGQFYVLAEDEDDQMYLAWSTGNAKKTVDYIGLSSMIKLGAKLGFLKEACEREVGQNPSSKDVERG